MSFGTRLQVLRHSNGITQEQFAQQLNVSRQAVSKWESSKGYPEIEKIIYICKHYGVTMDELFLDEVPPKPTTAQTEPAPEEEQPLENKPLKSALSNFFSNLSPKDQYMFAFGVGSILLVLMVLFCLFCTTISKGGSDEVIMKFTWLALLFLFTIGEALTVGLTSIWFAAGSLGALILALLEAPLWLQIAVFMVLSALCLLAVRPIIQKHFNNNLEATNADRILGSEAMVTEDILNIQGKGAVAIGGLIWSARSEHDVPIPAGTLVRVLRIEGVKVFVEELKEEEK